MAHDALTKEDLRHDPVQDIYFRATDYAYRNRRLLTAIGSVVTAVIVIGVVYVVHARYEAGRMAEGYNSAEAVLFDMSQSDGARLAKGEAAFRTFVDDFSGSALAPYAWMHIAAAAGEAGKTGEAETAYARVIEHSQSTPPLRAIARTALAKVFEDRGELAKSAELYSELREGLYGDLAEFSLARVAMAENKVDEARARLEAIQQQYPDSALSALARDTLYFVY
jgi:predicted negative regulator of RcsB-dependent stress response